MSDKGKVSNKNTLNDLTGKEWIYNTNSIESLEELLIEKNTDAE
tara:strand:+ start:1486 stop:1617 length:132 start_codon:yes stop_codon:yes gene_type:complete